MLEMIEEGTDNIVATRLSGQLDQTALHQLAARVETATSHGKVRLLLEVHAVQGVDPRLTLDDLKPVWRLRANLERVALLGDDVWIQRIARMGRPLVSGELRHFPTDAREEALDWLRSPESRRTPWQRLTPVQRSGIVLAGTVQIGLLVAALVDLTRRPKSLVNGPKALWAALSFVNFIGPIAYFTLGRRQARPPLHRVGGRLARHFKD